EDQTGALSHLASTLLILGYAEQSAAAAKQAVARARGLGLVFTIATILGHAAMLGILSGNDELAAYSHEAAPYSTEHGLADPAHWARFVQGALLAQGGDPERGVALMHEAMAAAGSNADLTRRTFFLGHLASAHARGGGAQTGLAVLDQAFEIVETT